MLQSMQEAVPSPILAPRTTYKRTYITRNALLFGQRKQEVTYLYLL
ncbi:MAG TPA: hypothetical protein VG122_22110 [Gemmata sp.]|nr:hypothetical protein [Gemmata sp.]